MSGTTILRGVVGSTAYGLDHEGSDIDRLGCFVVPTVEMLGLHPPADSRVQTSPSDYTEHEAAKYIALLLRCNPTVTELLWLPEELYEIVHPEGLALIALREKFLSGRMVRNAYLGYATQQFRKLSDRGDGSFSADTRKRTEKHARHLKRLCWQGSVLYSEGWLPIRVEDPEEYHDFGRKVADNPAYAQAMLEQYELVFNSVESPLPEKPDEEAAEAWLQQVRARHYDGPTYRGSAEAQALKYVTHLIDCELVEYRTIYECQHAMANMTRMFERAQEKKTAV